MYMCVCVRMSRKWSRNKQQQNNEQVQMRVRTIRRLKVTSPNDNGGNNGDGCESRIVLRYINDVDDVDCMMFTV